jgi:hypothetical protein
MPKTDKLSIAALKTAITKNKLEMPEGADPIAAADVLKKFYKDNFKVENLAGCLICGYASPDDLNACPFCGTDLGEPEEPKPVVKKRQPKDTTLIAKKKPGRKPKEESIAEPEPPDPELVKEIEDRVAKIRSYKENLVKNSYQIGLELKEINEKALFKAMGYPSFVKFCAEKLEYSRVMAYKYMALTHFSEEDALMLGPTKADMIAQAGAAEDGELSKKQKKLIEMVRKGASRADLEKELNKGKSSRTTADSDEKAITLVGRVKEGQLLIPWISDNTGKPTARNTKEKHAEVEIVTGILLTVLESPKGDGLVLKFSKVGEEETETPEPEETEEVEELEPEE